MLTPHSLTHWGSMDPCPTLSSPRLGWTTVLVMMCVPQIKSTMPPGTDGAQEAYHRSIRTALSSPPWRKLWAQDHTEHLGTWETNLSRGLGQGFQVSPLCTRGGKNWLQTWTIHQFMGKRKLLFRDAGHRNVTLRQMWREGRFSFHWVSIHSWRLWGNWIFDRSFCRKEEKKLFLIFL